MPLIEDSTYKPSPLFRNNHINTFQASLFRKFPDIEYERFRITTADEDFIDLDCQVNDHKRAVILLSGLEGDSVRNYMKGMAACFYKNGWDTISMNYRGCSGEPNLLPRTYHVGDTADLQLTIDFIQKKFVFKEIALIGFSMGGNIILKYLGETGKKINPVIISSATFSVACDIPSANMQMEKWYNWHYRKYLIGSLKQKYQTKIEAFPDQFTKPEKKFDNTFKTFDEHFTAPIHGFKSAIEYWKLNSSINFLKNISIPTLMVNALDDSFLSKECYPYKIAKESDYLFLETPEHGGHLGFSGDVVDDFYWSERRAVAFIQSVSRAS